jgi:hypothetical protein
MKIPGERRLNDVEDQWIRDGFLTFLCQPDSLMTHLIFFQFAATLPSESRVPYPIKTQQHVSAAP